MKNYVVAHYKSTLRPTLFRMILTNGNMNPEMGDVELVKSPTVNDKLSFYVRIFRSSSPRSINNLFLCLQCNNIIEDHEEDFISAFTKSEKDAHAYACVTKTGICPKGAVENNSASENDSDSYNFEHEDL